MVGRRHLNVRHHDFVWRRRSHFVWLARRTALRNHSKVHVKGVDVGPRRYVPPHCGVDIVIDQHVVHRVTHSASSNQLHCVDPRRQHGALDQLLQVATVAHVMLSSMLLSMRFMGMPPATRGWQRFVLQCGIRAQDGRLQHVAQQCQAPPPASSNVSETHSRHCANAFACKHLRLVQARDG